MKLALCCAIPLLAGCVSVVPRTEISFDPVTHTVGIKSPKDVELTGLRVEIVEGAANVAIDKYSAKNNYEVVKAVADANAAALKDLTDKGAALIDAAISASR